MTKLERLIRLCQKLPIDHFPKILTEHGFKYTFIAQGLSRQTYKIDDLPVVIKLEGFKEKGCPWQSPNEIKIVRAIERLKKYEPLRPYTPKIYYSKSRAYKNLIVAHYYPLSYEDVPDDIHNKSREKIQDLFENFGFDTRELCGSNIRYTEAREPVAVDLGS